MSGLWRKIRIGFAVAVAVVACPCHLPLTVPLILAATGGTLFGLGAAQIYGPLFIVFAVLFVGGLYFSFLWIDGKSKAAECKTPNSRRGDTATKIKVGRIRTGANR